MKHKILISTLLLGSSIGIQAVKASPLKINCPISSARVEMTTNLPSGWWRTPYVSRLQSTDISTVGGKKTLICKYGNHAAFWTMKLVPNAKTCNAVRDGFICKNKVTQTPPRTHKTGPLVIPQTYQADLDDGVVRSQDADIWFQAKTATQRYITPRNGAKIGVAGNRSVNLAGCKSMSLGNQSIPLSRVPEGTYVCVKTNQGRYSQFRVNRRVGPSPGILHIGYTTWKK